MCETEDVIENVVDETLLDEQRCDTRVTNDIDTISIDSREANEVHSM